MALRYAKFIEELLEARAWKKSDLAKAVGVKPEVIYEYLEQRHEPRASLAKAIEQALGINLKPQYYGWGDTTK